MRRIGRARATLFPASHVMGPLPRGLGNLPLWLPGMTQMAYYMVMEASGLYALRWIAPCGVYVREVDHERNDPQGPVVSWQFSQQFFMR